MSLLQYNYEKVLHLSSFIETLGNCVFPYECHLVTYLIYSYSYVLSLGLLKLGLSQCIELTPF